MKIGIIDADLIYNQEHNFPNLACMKLSGYHKKKGDDVRLISYSEISQDSLFTEHFDTVYISKVFTETKVPENVLKMPFVQYGGTGFYYDKAPNLPDEIEHSFPDYHLYNDWIKERGKTKKAGYFKYYTDFSIGFTTRGCFRKCEFCVNRNETRVNIHSPLTEFIDPERKKICLLDDNVLGCGQWESIFKDLQSTGKPFQFKQGMDIRILSDKKAELMAQSKYEGDYIFAFDNIADRDIIEKKLAIFKKWLPNIVPKLYVFCGFDRQNKWDGEFWINDIIDVFERFKLLMKYKSLPYLMKYYRYKESKYATFYNLISSWGTPIIFKKQSIRQYHSGNRELLKFEKQHPDIAAKYFDLKFGCVE